MRHRAGVRLLQQYYLRNRRAFHCHVDLVKPGILVLDSPIDIQISPVAFAPQQTKLKAEAKLVSSDLDPTALQSLTSTLDIALKEDEVQNELCISVPSKLSQQPLGLHITIPHHYSVMVNGTGNASLELSKMECDSTDISLEDGNCELNNMKTLTADIKGNNGDLTFAGSFLGDVTAAIGTGTVTADKLQGQRLSIDVSKGSIDINSLYATSCNLRCRQGNIKVANCHGSTTVTTDSGNINLNSVDGELQAHAVDGDIDVHLTNYTSVQLVSALGQADVSVSETAAGAVLIRTEELDVDDSLILDVKSTEGNSSHVKGTLGTVDELTSVHSSLHIQAKSTRLKMMDWITAQKIVFAEDPH